MLLKIQVVLFGECYPTFRRVRVSSSSGLCSTRRIVSQNTSMPGALEPWRQKHYDISKRRGIPSDKVSHLRRFGLWIF